jgi:hypothetical protein|tara:strand:+ start:713 stop:901 length:189 start_codon:yes stop_codon:yes gene_type:complete
MGFIEALEQPAMFQFDIAVVCIFLGLAVWCKWSGVRLGLFVGGMLYLFFAILWHMPWELYVQ